MKNLIIFSTFILSNLFLSQGFEKIDGKTTFTNITETSKSKNEIYKAIKLWLNDTPNKSKNFIDMDDFNLGILSFNVVSEEFTLSEFLITQIEYKVTIEFKENKFRFKATDFSQKHKIAGIKITFPFEELSDLSANEKKISDLENERKQETKERKLRDIDKKIVEEKTEMSLKVNAYEKFKQNIENFPTLLKQKIENYSDF